MRMYKTSRAFTLIEILIALFIFVIVLQILSMSFKQFIISKEVMSHQAQNFIDLQKSMLIIENDMKQIVSWERLVQDKDLGSFYTQEDGLYFSRMGYMNLEWSSQNKSGNPSFPSILRQVRYIYKDKTLYRETYDDQNTMQSHRVLFDNVLTLQWILYDAQGGEYQQWPPTYDWRNRIPNGIGLMISTKEYPDIQRLFFIHKDEPKTDDKKQSSTESVLQTQTA